MAAAFHWTSLIEPRFELRRHRLSPRSISLVFTPPSKLAIPSPLYNTTPL